MFEIEKLTFAYGQNLVLRGVSASVKRGQVVGLIGPNGSGKTTLLRTLYGSLKPKSGRVLFQGQDVHAMATRSVAQQIAVVVQESSGDMMHTVADTVLMGRTPHLKMFQRRGKTDDELAAGALQQVGALHLANRQMDELSGGEKQRVLMARALVQEAQCLLLDEPTNHLDIAYQHQILQLVHQIGLTTVVVLHDLNLAARYCDSIVMLSGGAVRASGPPREVLSPTIIDPVYGVLAQGVTADDGTLQLLFNKEPAEQLCG